MSGRYKTADAFRAALDARIRKEAGTTQRMHQRVLTVYLMQRLVARVLDELGSTVTVKGGLALELRLQRARSTNDVDLRFGGGAPQVLDRLRIRALRADDPDWMTFDIEEHPAHPRIEGAGVIYEGVRLRAQAHLGGKKYGPAFGVDLAIGDPMIGQPDYRCAANLLDIIDARPLEIPVYPLATHLAEKVHAYTLPREGPNSRIKDLIDLALVAAELTVDGSALRAALDATFDFRRSHALPTSLRRPPGEWEGRYPREREVHGLPWPSIDEVHGEAARFLDPVLAGGGGMWEPGARAWSGDGAATPGA